MLGIGESELFLIILFAFLVFGPDKLPGMGRTLGRALRQFRNAQEGFTQVVQTEVIDPATEAMGVDGKKPNRDRSAEFEEDADIEDNGSDAPRPRRAETFAERKARLAAEKAAAAAATEAAADQKDAPDAADAAAATEPAQAPEPAEEKPRTAADLYAMAPRRSSRSVADDEKAAAEAARADAPAADAAENANETGKEDGSAEA